MTTINGRTPEEIKNGLECCSTEAGCPGCPYYKECVVEQDINLVTADALAYIQQLERERDAAVEQLRRADKENLFECTHCKHNVSCSEILLGCDVCDNSECPCSTCVDLSNWQWRGVQEVEE